MRAANPKSLFLRFCRTWTKRYLITSQTRVKRVSRIHHRTILMRYLITSQTRVKHVSRIHHRTILMRTMRMVRWCIRLTRLTLVCEVIRYRLVQVRQVFFSVPICKQGVCMKQTTFISAHCWMHWWESDYGKSLSVITLAQTSPWRPRDMPAVWTMMIQPNIGRATGVLLKSSPDRHHKDDGKPQQLSPLP